jgi:predicted DNA-binding protein YlxM (UPF0122 family)
MSEKAKKNSLRNKHFSVKEINLVKQMREYADIGVIAEESKIARQSITSALKSWKTSENTHEAIMSFYKKRSAEKLKEMKLEIEKIQDLN